MQREIHYRLPRRTSGWRPGSHRGSSFGAGQEFISHARLYDRPDPRRLDLRASLTNIQQEWLVRVNRQRASITVHVLVDVSASMSFGPLRSKLQTAADFVEALGQSTARLGDSLGMRAFDAREREDLHAPPMRGRGVGENIAARIRQARGAAGNVGGLQEVTGRLSARGALVFVVSDFHWPLAGLGAALDPLAQSVVVPIVLWDPAEIRPPSSNGLAQLRDMESGARRTVWMRPGLRAKWRAAALERRHQLDEVFLTRAMVAFHVNGDFNCDALSQYFFELA